MANFNKTNKIHDYMPAIYNTKSNPNWRAFVEAVGDSDQETADLIEAVRKQFFVKTASRPYIDRLGTVSNVQRPRFVGMDDQTFREFIPVMSYNPKQVKLVLDRLLDLFFFKDSTTSFIQTSEYEPFNLKDGWELEYLVDGINNEKIKLYSSDFADISNASASEIVSAINRQVQYSYAISYEDSITGKTYIRIFTNTIGAKGSLSMIGGLANIGMKFDGFNDDAGNGNDTQWTVSIVGDTVTYTYLAGEDPNITAVSKDDVVLIDMDDNRGYYTITDVDIVNKSFSFTGLFNTAGTYTQTSSDDVKFMVNFVSHVYTQNRRALTWEVRPGEIIVEIPPSPPVVKRNRKGAAHINGVTSLVDGFPSSSSIELKEPDRFPEDGGKFLIEQLNEIKTEISATTQTSYTFNSRLISDQPVYSYTSRVGNTLMGVTPELPSTASLNKFSISSISRVSNELTVTTSSEHGYSVDEHAIVSDTGSPDLDGTHKITEILSSTSFKCWSPGADDSAVTGYSRVERIGISDVNSKVILRSSKLEPDMLGPYIWSEDTDFVLSSYTTNITSEINAGTTSRNILVEENDLPSEEGQLIFDFGTEKQEGPVRYFYKPSDYTIAIDPAYVFKFNHEVGSAVTKINRKGGIQFKGDGSERSPYITDPSAAREVLSELMEDIKSVGVFLNFIVRFPELFYGTVDVYRSGIDPG